MLHRMNFFAVPYEYPLPIITKTNWTLVDTQKKGELDRYLDNVKTLKETITLPGDTPELPTSMKDLLVNDANNIEKVLRIVNDATLALEALKRCMPTTRRRRFGTPASYSAARCSVWLL